jgi:lipopolysaccharide exporter
MSAVPAESIAGEVRRGLVWSTVNSMVLRLGSLALGILLARLLAPADFGVFAIALSIQTVLMTLADPGMSVELVRAHDPARRAPTIATLSLASGVLLALAMTVTAGPVADLMGAPDAAGVIMVLSAALVVCGAGVVPYAHLQRNFHQRKLFVCAVVDFAVGTGVTVTLVLLGMGPMALAIGRLVAQVVAMCLMFMLSGLRPRFGFDRNVARRALKFGLPLTGANMLSIALVTIDNLVIAGIAGVTSLGLYVLAFNISSWPMSVIGQAVRGVSLAGFSHTSRREGQEGNLVTALALTWAAALPVGVLLAALAHPLVVLLYGERWSASATVLAALGVFGALRVALDLVATYLMAHGASRAVLYVQVLWFVTLIPTVVSATQWIGIAGAGWAHLAVSAVVTLPAYAVALSSIGTDPRSLVTALWPAAAAAVPTWWVAHTAAGQVQEPLFALLLGGVLGALTYIALSYRWVRRLLPDARAPFELRATQPGDEPRLEGVT